MKFSSRFWLVCTLMVAVGCAPKVETPKLARNWPATVWIRNGDAFGCGVVIWEDGLVLTAAHVVAAAKPVKVLIPGEGGSDTGTRLPAEIITTSSADLALLRVNHRFTNAVRIADARELLPGDPVYGVMIYYDLGKVVGRGYVAKTHFTSGVGGGREGTRDVLMTYYPGVSGSSGSGIYRPKDGALLGVNTVRRVIETESGRFEVNFVIPGYKIIKFLDDAKAPYHPSR